KHLLYFESTVDTSGLATVTATFQPGTDADMAQVDVQNRLKVIEPRLPQAVRQAGLTVDAASPNFLMFFDFISPDGSYDEAALGDYAARSVMPELKRLEGVGRVQLFGSERAMRIWIDPARLVSYNLTLDDVTDAIARQNVEVAPGMLGADPAVKGQRVTVPLTVQGQLQTPEEFAAIVLKAGSSGSAVTIGDVARVELGAQSLAFTVRANGHKATALGIQLAPGANAVKVEQAALARVKELKTAMPRGIDYIVSYNTAPFVKISIEKVVVTLIEAMVLVFLVMFLFLQNIRYTLIPAIVAPIALLGTFTVMLVAGFSINVLTMFGMVLAVGIIVDDAIVVVENVERLMAEEGLSPREATVRAMKEITGAVVGITLVLSAVFIPMAMASGTVGGIYRQFTLSMAVSILFSAFLALSLTPALCATILKPVDRHARKRAFFAWFDRGFDRLGERYHGWVSRLLRYSGRAMIGFAVIVVLLVFSFVRLPSAFLPEEDQGYFFAMFQLPADATTERTADITRRYEAHMKTRPGILDNEIMLGFGFAGSGPNVALAFSSLKDWGERQGATVAGEIELAMQAMADAPEGFFMAFNPPAIDGLGTSAGFALRLEDRANQGYEALVAAQNQLLGLAAQSELVSGVYPENLPASTSVRLAIDRVKAQTLGVPFSMISDTLTGAMGSRYVNDFPNQGRMQQVIVQADAPYRMQISDILNLYVRSDTGGMVRLSEVVNPVWGEMPLQLSRYNGYPAMKIAGTPAPGVSSGEAMAEMERLGTQLPKGFALSWTGQSLQEKQAGAEAPMLLLLSMLVVFLVLAALYESWTIPLAVMLVVPLGLIGAFAAVQLRGLPNDVFFKVGMITIIGLSAKNAILIVEFARQYYDQGMTAAEAALTAAKMRLRPILMTSLAFTLGVVPLVLARGASAETQNAIGTGVFGGMISGTVLAVLLVPVFFVVVMRLGERMKARRSVDRTRDIEA
ncbi:MAG: multidrug efflux RND transporter permease subunit, partial [Novosphingobium sp.]